MNIQIFGTTKCFDTKKAQRYFKERGIKFQMIDLKEKEMSRGEFENVSRALGGWQALVNPNAKDKQTLALLDALVDWQKEDKLFENQQLFRTPIVRNGRQDHNLFPFRHKEIHYIHCFPQQTATIATQIENNRFSTLLFQFYQCLLYIF